MKSIAAIFFMICAAHGQQDQCESKHPATVAEDDAQGDDELSMLQVHGLADNLLPVGDQEVYDYIILARNKNECPSESKSLVEMEKCRFAAGKFGKIDGFESVDEAKAPGGCFMDTSGQIFHNKAEGKADSKLRKVCKKEVAS
mmetsp:Transcript_5698/g.9241  ORF Transcript_5698/g.9241 Transcript_5698/m.9241 type:complete len:143 (-) Transcript_5698:155-583(-)